MKEFEEHLRAITEQVRIRRKLLKDFTENHDSIRSRSELIMYEEEIEQKQLVLAKKRRIQTKFEDEIEQYRVKIDRADQIVCN